MPVECKTLTALTLALNARALNEKWLNLLPPVVDIVEEEKVDKVRVVTLIYAAQELVGPRDSAVWKDRICISYDKNYRKRNMQHCNYITW